MREYSYSFCQNNIAQPFINLGMCESILKTNNNIEDDENLIIFLININKTDELLNKLVYEVYSKTEGNKLNITIIIRNKNIKYIFNIEIYLIFLLIYS